MQICQNPLSKNIGFCTDALVGIASVVFSTISIRVGKCARSAVQAIPEEKGADLLKKEGNLYPWENVPGQRYRLFRKKGADLLKKKEIFTDKR